MCSNTDLLSIPNFSLTRPVFFHLDELNMHNENYLKLFSFLIILDPP